MNSHLNNHIRTDRERRRAGVLAKPPLHGGTLLMRISPPVAEVGTELPGRGTNVSPLQAKTGPEQVTNAGPVMENIQTNRAQSRVVFVTVAVSVQAKEQFGVKDVLKSFVLRPTY